MGGSPDFYRADRLQREAFKRKAEAYLLGALLGGSPLIFLAAAFWQNT